MQPKNTTGAKLKEVRDAGGAKRYVIFLTVVPTLLFFGVAWMFAWGSFNYSKLTYFVAICLFCSGWVKMSSGLAEGGERPYDLPLGFMTLMCTVIGAVFGLYLFDTYAFFTFMYQNARVYQDVVPSASAAAYADAGRMSFAQEVYLDGEKSVGYSAEDGHIYCVAPIRDLAQASHVEWWAVGYDCCGASGDFRCDGAKVPNARGGIVVFDNPGWFGNSNKDRYALARKKAEATFDLNAGADVRHPLYVRWVETKNINKVGEYYSSMTWVILGFGTLIFTLPALGFAVIANLALYQRK